MSPRKFWLRPRPTQGLAPLVLTFIKPIAGLSRFIGTLLGLFALGGLSGQAAQVELIIRDGATGQPMPARVHLKDSQGKPVRPERLPFWRDHFVCDGQVKLELAPGAYTYEIERGPEFSAVTNSFALAANVPTNLTVTLKRLANLAAEGWWSGEMHVHRAPEDVELLMRAEDLHVAQVITWWNKQNRWTNGVPASPLVRFDSNRFYHLMAGEDERDGGALLFFGLNKPFDITRGERFFPHSIQFARDIRKTRGVWVDCEKPFWWDFPAWVAAGVADSVGVANNHMYRTGVYESEAWGRPRDSKRLPAPQGNGQWTQEIYYHLLNCGIRLPPSAGSASGVLPNSLGYNRVYVNVDGELTWDKWWQGLRAGRVFVSNGPLLRCRVGGKLPGHVFPISQTGLQGDAEFELNAALSSRDPIKAIEIVKNGKVVRTVAIPADGKIRSLGEVVSFSEPGWFLVRAIADEPRTFRFASTGPFYVESPNGAQRISRASAQFFLDWVHERMEKLQAPTAAQREELLIEWRNAENFWRDRLAKANAE